MNDTALAFIHPGVVDTLTAVSIARWEPFGAVIPMGGVQRISNLDSGIRAFLASDLEWWFQIDTDLILPPDALEKLKATEHRMASGLYFDYKFGRISPIYGFIMDGEFYKPDDIRPMVAAEQVLEVDTVPEGCLLIHRSIFEEVLNKFGEEHTYPFFYEALAEHGGVRTWEERTFFDRAFEATGEKPVVHHGVLCTHIKKRHISYETYREALN